MEQPQKDVTSTNNASEPTTISSADMHITSDHQSNRSSISELANHTSLEWARHDSLDRMRHRTEFATLGVLGQGGFGVTFRVKNRVDGKIYALKRVFLGHEVDDVEKVLREVKALSSLHSENVVRYYAAWVEKGDGEFVDSTGSDCDEYSTDASWSPSIRTSTNTGGINQQRDNPVCHLCQSTYIDWEVSLEQWGLLDAVLQPKFLCMSCYKESLPNTVDASTIRIRETMPFFLFILMEYCESTLQQAVDDVHNQCKDDEDGKKDAMLWNYFAQCVKGLEHCHSQFIHRDIKANNIFVHKGVVKLGDLGLATHDTNSNTAGTAALSISRSHDSDDSTPQQQSQASMSSQVGTFLYTAPEVASGNYDEKCDVFSLGVVLVEMWSRFSTGMERADVLQKLHSGQILPAWSEKHPLPAKLARTMVAVEPSSRPSCSQILRFLREEGIGDQKNPTEQLVADLQNRNQTLQQCLERKDETIQKLRDLLEEEGIPHDHIA